MRRYFEVLKLFWATAIAAEMEYRINFVLAAFSSFGSLLGSLFGLSLFYPQGADNSVETFQGWSWPEALLVLGIFTLLQGISATFLVPNLNRIVRHVQEGTLDFILLKPISSQFWLSTYSISPWGLPDVTFGLMLIGYAGTRLSLGLSQYLSSVIPVALGVIILYSLWFMLGATSIWFVKIYNVTEVLRGLVEAGRYPIAAYPTAYRIFFTFIVPVTFLTTVPAEVMLQRTSGVWLFGSFGLASLLFLIANRFWRFALRFYTSASS
ncbi:MAG: ABC transporter permease [Cyanobacteria bacterium P01_A01_bin.17]